MPLTPLGLFTRTVSVSVSITISIKVYDRVNGNGPFDRENGLRTHSYCQTDRHHVHNVNLTETVTDTETETVRVNRPSQRVLKVIIVNFEIRKIQCTRMHSVGCVPYASVAVSTPFREQND